MPVKLLNVNKLTGGMLQKTNTDVARTRWDGEPHLYPSFDLTPYYSPITDNKKDFSPVYGLTLRIMNRVFERKYLKSSFIPVFV
jgi:hypothetical protein